MKNTFSLVSTYMNWSSLSLPCLDTDPHKRISPNHTELSNCTEPQVSVILIVFTVVYEYQWRP